MAPVTSQTTETTCRDGDREQTLLFTRHPAQEPRKDARKQANQPNQIAGECLESAAQ